MGAAFIFTYNLVLLAHPISNIYLCKIEWTYLYVKYPMGSEMVR